LKQWKEEVFNNVKVRKQQILNEIATIDQCDDDETLQERMRVRSMQLLSELRIVSERERLQC